VRVEQKKCWVVPLEIELRQRVRTISDQHAQLQETQTATTRLVQTIVIANEQVRVALVETQGALKQRESQRGQRNGLVEEKLLDELIKRDQARISLLQKQWIEPARLGETPQLRSALVELTNRRNDLTISILWVHEQRPALKKQYATLAQDAAVMRSLRQVGNQQRLGPVEDYDSDRFLKGLAKFEAAVFTTEVPLYREHGALRVAGLIERTPVTFTWKESSEPTMITASVIEAAGLVVPENAPRTQQRVEDGRMLSVRRFTIPYVRFGKQVLRDVPALALPPEGENIGTQIGTSAFTGLSPKAEPEKFRLVIR
jgi:hypothetical protein